MTSLPRSAGALARPVVRPAIRPSRQIGRKPRPVLLFLVYGVFLVIVGVTATAQVMLASVHVSTSALNQAVLTDTQVVRGFVDDLLKPADLTAPSIAADRQSALEDGLKSFITPRGIIRAEIRRLDGTILASDAPIAGLRVPNSADWQTALAGHTAVSLAAVGRERGRTGRPRHGHGDPRVPPAHPGRRGRRRGRGVARRHADHDRASTRPGGT